MKVFLDHFGYLWVVLVCFAFFGGVFGLFLWVFCVFLCVLVFWGVFGCSRFFLVFWGCFLKN